MGYKQDCADAAQAQAEGNSQLAKQRERELEAQRDALRIQDDARKSIQKREDEQMERLEKQQEGDLAKLLDFQKDQRAKNQERSDRLQKEQEESVAAAIKDGQDALDKQRNRNQTERQNMTTAHQDVLKKRETQIAETETKADAKVLELKQQKEKLQDNLNNDRKEYHEKQLAAGRQHALEMEKHLERSSELQLQRDKDAIAHETAIGAIKMFGETTKIAVTTAVGRDETESHFADSVSNARRVAAEVSRAVSSLERNAVILRDGLDAPPRVVAALEATNDRLLRNQLRNLESAAIGILEQKESLHSSVIECQRIARQIQIDITTLSSSVNDFMAILQYSPITESRSLFKKVQDANKALQATVSSLPSIVKTQHAIGVLVQSTQSIQLGRNFIEQTNTTAAIVNVEDDNQ